MNNYFDLLIQTNRTATIMIKVISKYLSDKKIRVNANQVMILHLLMKLGGEACPFEVQEDLNVFNKSNTYNFKSLSYRGYLISKKGEEADFDNRCKIYAVTEKGKKFYEDICQYCAQKVKQLHETLKWDEDNFADYFADLEALQDFLRNK